SARKASPEVRWMNSFDTPTTSTTASPSPRDRGWPVSSALLFIINSLICRHPTKQFSLHSHGNFIEPPTDGPDDDHDDNDGLGLDLLLGENHSVPKTGSYGQQLGENDDPPADSERQPHSGEDARHGGRDKYPSGDGRPACAEH